MDSKKAYEINSEIMVNTFKDNEGVNVLELKDRVTVNMYGKILLTLFESNKLSVEVIDKDDKEVLELIEPIRAIFKSITEGIE